MREFRPQALNLVSYEDNMPRKTVPETSKPEPKPKSPALVQPRKSAETDEWGGYVQANLAPLDKAIFDQWYSEHMQHVQAFLDDHIGMGLKLTVVFDGEHNSYIASYTGRPDTDPNFQFRCTLSARAGEFLEALAVLVYKEEQITSHDWKDFLLNGSRVSNWG